MRSWSGASKSFGFPPRSARWGTYGQRGRALLRSPFTLLNVLLRPARFCVVAVTLYSHDTVVHSHWSEKFSIEALNSNVISVGLRRYFIRTLHFKLLFSIDDLFSRQFTVYLLLRFSSSECGKEMSDWIRLIPLRQIEKVRNYETSPNLNNFSFLLTCSKVPLYGTSFERFI